MTKAAVLIVDDNESPSGLEQHLNSTDSVVANTLHPNEVEIDDLRKADLVLVDYTLDQWPERDELSQVSLKPPDGLALTAIYRSYSQAHEKDSPTAIAILTGQIDRLANPLPHENREHALARLNNLEWVFQKAKPGEEPLLAIQIVDLATAVTRLPQQWTSDEARPRSQLGTLLGLDLEEPLSERLLEDVEGCAPPIHELSQWSHGLAVLRWLLQGVLPYPCFLWDAHYLAARLTIDYDAFAQALSQDNRVKPFFEGAQYKGILQNFLGVRWWRADVEALLWEITDGNSNDPKIVRAEFRAGTGNELPASKPSLNPIVCVNSNYQALGQFYSMDDSVRIRPDDWPAYADQAWTPIELAKSEPKIRSLVLADDIDRLRIDTDTTA